MERTAGHEEQAAPPVLRRSMATGSATGSTAGPAPRIRVRTSMPIDSADPFGDLAPRERLQLELVVRASVSPETALPHAIAVLVPNPAARQRIIDAFRTNDQLREQWERAWTQLRA